MARWLARLLAVGLRGWLWQGLTRADKIAVEMAVKAADKMAVDWFDLVVGEMWDCWGEKMVLLRSGLRAGWLIGCELDGWYGWPDGCLLG